jgi:hypothetical protein
LGDLGAGVSRAPRPREPACVPAAGAPPKAAVVDNFDAVPPR